MSDQDAFSIPTLRAIAEVLPSVRIAVIRGDADRVFSDDSLGRLFADIATAAADALERLRVLEGKAPIPPLPPRPGS